MNNLWEGVLSQLSSLSSKISWKGARGSPKSDRMGFLRLNQHSCSLLRLYTWTSQPQTHFTCGDCTKKNKLPRDFMEMLIQQICVSLRVTI